jgi:hypothetical protein
MVSGSDSKNRGCMRSRARPETRRIRVENMRDKKNDSDRADGYEYRADDSSSKNWKEILEVDQFCYIFVYEL